MYRWTFTAAMWVMTISAAAAHKEEQHHWTSGEYHHEILWQMAAFGILLLLYTVPKMYLWLKRKGTQ